MSNLVLNNMKHVLAAGMLLLVGLVACERAVDGLSEPELTSNPEVFIDSFSPGLEYYPYEGSVMDAFSVDSRNFFGNRGASMRFDVPNVGDPAGPFAGAIFRDDFGGRNLTPYNALTFYAKGTRGGAINDIGFGQDFLGNQFEVSRKNLPLTTNWRKYIIPIPNSAVLSESRGLFWYAEGPENGEGYTFWIDNLKYENVENMAQPRPAIFNGSEITQTSFIGSGTQITGLSYTINQPDGQDVTVTAAPAYFNFNSSNPAVATVDGSGQVKVVGEGDAEITATLGGTRALGSLKIVSKGAFTSAPTPTRNPANVISIFSDAYENVPVDFYNGFYEPWQTTTSNDFEVNGDNVLAYENFNFVGIEFRQNVPTINGTNMTHLSVDIFVPNQVPPGSAFRVRLVNNVGAGAGETSAATTVFANSGTPRLVSGQWITMVVDIRSMANRSNLGQIVMDSDQGAALRGATIWVDNIYLYNANAPN
jgi:hypothetical protein